MLSFHLEDYLFVIDSSLVQTNLSLLYTLLVRQNGTKQLLRTSLLLSLYGYIRILRFFTRSDLFDLDVSVFMISFCPYFLFWLSYQVEDNVWYCNFTIYFIGIRNGSFSRKSSVAFSGFLAWLWSHLLLKFLYIQSSMFFFNC